MKLLSISFTAKKGILEFLLNPCHQIYEASVLFVSIQIFVLKFFCNKLRHFPPIYAKHNLILLRAFTNLQFDQP